MITDLTDSASKPALAQIINPSHLFNLFARHLGNPFVVTLRFGECGALLL